MIFYFFLLFFRSYDLFCFGNKISPLNIDPPIRKEDPIELNAIFKNVKKIKIMRE